MISICSKEDIKYTHEGLFLLAKSANGSARDCLSLLDQAIVYSDKNITENKIIAMLGQGEKEDIYNLFINIVKNDKEKSFEILFNQYEKGIELDLLIEDLLEVCHNATLIKITNNVKLLDISESEKNKASEIATLSDLTALMKLWQILIQGLKEVKEHNNSLQFASMLITKALLVSSIGDLGKIVDFLKNQEKKNLTLISPNPILPNKREEEGKDFEGKSNIVPTEIKELKEEFIGKNTKSFSSNPTMIEELKEDLGRKNSILPTEIKEPKEEFSNSQKSHKSDLPPWNMTTNKFGDLSAREEVFLRNGRPDNYINTEGFGVKELNKNSQQNNLMEESTHFPTIDILDKELQNNPLSPEEEIIRSKLYQKFPQAKFLGKE